MTKIARVLSIAGSDSSGGAGIQADIKTMTMMDAFSMTAITALTAQNTLGVEAMAPTDPDVLVSQIRCCVDDIGVDAIKIGMMVDKLRIESIAKELSHVDSSVPIILDPVMISTSGSQLLSDDAIGTLITKLFPRSFMITPNLDEASALIGRQVKNLDDMKDAAYILRDMGPQWVLIKGGHLEEPVICDLLVGPDTQEVFSEKKIHTSHTHGTGCVLSSAIAVGVAEGKGAIDSVKFARKFVRNAIKHAPGLGQGNGPLGFGEVL